MLTQYFLFYKIIRVQTQDGLKRINISKNASLKDLYEIVYKSLNLLDYGFSLFTDRKFSNEVRSTRSATLNKSNLKHGDILYYKQMAGTSSVSPFLIIHSLVTVFSYK